MTKLKLARTIVVQVLPPLLLFWLVMYYEILGLVLVISAISLAVKWQRRKSGKPGTSWELIRPALASLICACLLAVLFLARAAAENDAREIAHDLLARCERERACPRGLEGWEPASPGGMVSRKWGRYPSFTLYYAAPQDQRSFVLTLRYGFEDRFEIRGTIGEPVLQIERRIT